jgi:CheY-like chemotaxis protein
MPHGGTLTIETGQIGADETTAGAPGEFALITVRDTGAGMAPSISARAFEPFFTTRSDQGRSGLGLSQVYGYARQSGGYAEIDSDTGGTSVRLFLPRDRTEPAGRRVVPPSRAGGETILMVEDAPLVRRAVARMLSDLGYSVLAATDAEEALQFIESEAAIDLLFTDIMLPGALDGDELAVVAQRLRPGLRVLCTSGYSEIHAEDRAERERFGYIAKPYSKAELALQLRSALAADGSAS